MRMGLVRSGSGRFIRSFSTNAASFRSIARDASLWMIESHDVLERRGTGDRVRGEASGHHRRFDAPVIVSAVGPVAGDSKVVIVIVERGNPMLDAPREAERIAIGWVHVGGSVLRPETNFAERRRLSRIVSRILLGGVRKQLPPEFAP